MLTVQTKQDLDLVNPNVINHDLVDIDNLKINSLSDDVWKTVEARHFIVNFLLVILWSSASRPINREYESWFLSRARFADRLLKRLSEPDWELADPIIEEGIAKTLNVTLGDVGLAAVAGGAVGAALLQSLRQLFSDRAGAADACPDALAGDRAAARGPRSRRSDQGARAGGDGEYPRQPAEPRRHAVGIRTRRAAACDAGSQGRIEGAADGACRNHRRSAIHRSGAES